MRTIATVAFSLLLLAAPVLADCPCVPITHFWGVKTCTDWTCASTELAVANGDPQVIAFPVGMNDGRWLIVRRFAAGAAIDSDGDTFHIDQFDGMSDAVQRFNGFSPDHKPMLMTAPDGRFLVIALRHPEPRRRAAAH